MLIDRKRLIFFLITGAMIALVVASCSKDGDPERLRKESLTLTLNNEISADTLESLVTWMENMGTRFALAAFSRIGR